MSPAPQKRSLRSALAPGRRSKSAMVMSTPFARKTISWHRAVLQAIAVNARIVAALLAVYTTSTGAENSLAFYVALILQFPASLLLSPMIVLTVLFKRPWAD